MRGYGVVLITAQRAGGSNEVKQQAVAPNDTAVAGVGTGENVGDSGGDHNSYHVEEVIHSDNDDPGLIIAGFLDVTGRWSNR